MLATHRKRNDKKKASGSPSMRNRETALPLQIVIITTVLWTGLLIGFFTGSAEAVAVDIGEASGTVGDIVTVAITTEDVTGADVYSYETTITWGYNSASVVEVIVSGTLTESWGDPTVNIQAGRIDIAAAGTAPLAGEGDILLLRFLLGPSSSNANLVFENFVYNEGDPEATLTNGYLTISALPVIYISPNSGEVAVGDSLSFSTSYGTPPYTYGTTDELIGDFAGTNYLKGISPGEIFAFSQDDAGVSDTTTSPIFVRALKLTVGDESGLAGETILVPIYITDPVDYDIKSAEFSISYYETRLTAIGIEQAGTIAEAAGWTGSACSISEGQVSVSMAGISNLPGPGILVYVEFEIEPDTYTGNVILTIFDGMFNETYPPVHENGTISISTLPVITIYPDNSTIVAGDIIDFNISGSVMPPLDWGVTDPVVAEIDASGIMTGLVSGSTRVYVTDDIGATDTTDVITVCDLYVVVEEITLHTVFPTAVPVSPDRDVSGMDIYGYEMILNFNAARVEVESVSSSGTLSEGWGTPVINTATPGEVRIVNAGSTPLTGTLPFFTVNMVGLPGSEGYSSNLDIADILFNEGEPCALPVNASLGVVTESDDSPIPTMELHQNYPNPFNPLTTIRYTLSGKGRATLKIFSSSGHLITTLVDRVHQPEILYEVNWDGTNERGRKVSSGIYLYRLEDDRDMIVKKMILLR